MTRDKEKDLLEVLAQQMGCLHLSDLKFLRGDDKNYLSGIVERIETSDFTLAQWADAFRYLTGDHTRFDTAASAKRALLNQLKSDDTDCKGSNSI